MGQRGFWDVERRQQTLSQKKDFLDRLDALIPWETFRPLLEQIHLKERKSNAGRKATDVLLMFKLLILQQLYNISDEELEYQVNDRLSFMRFLGLGFEDTVPDATTVWLFRQRLLEQGLVESLFEQFDGYLIGAGYQAKQGQILDATFIPVPKQHFTKEEKEQLEAGQVPDSLQNNPHKASQKDTDARWTKKNNTSYFGYKDHINVDVEYGFIREYAVSDAAMHDSQLLSQLLDADNEADGIWADSAYRSELNEEVLSLIGFESHIHQRAYRNRPLNEQQQNDNRERSKIRARVEHVFGRWTMEMGGKLMRSIGLKRAKVMIGLKNLCYNFKRFVFWQGQCAQ